MVTKNMKKIYMAAAKNDKNDSPFVSHNANTTTLLKKIIFLSHKKMKLDHNLHRMLKTIPLNNKKMVNALYT